MSSESAHERAIRLERKFKQDNRREFPLSSYEDNHRSEWLREKRDDGVREGGRILDLDRYGSLEAAEEALGLRPKPQPVSHRNVVEATTSIFRELVPRDAKVLVHYYEDQWTGREVAAELGLHLSQVQKVIKRALNRARKVADGLGITQLWARGKLVNLPAYEDDSPGALLAEDQTEVGGASNTRVRAYKGPLRGADMTTVRVKQPDGTYRNETCAKLGTPPPGRKPLEGVDFSGGEAAFLAGRPAWYKRRPDATAYVPPKVGSPRRWPAQKYDSFPARIEVGIPFHRMFERGLVAALTKFSAFWGEGENEAELRKIATKRERGERAPWN